MVDQNQLLRNAISYPENNGLTLINFYDVFTQLDAGNGNTHEQHCMYF
jgi:hypothetical protein